MTRSHGARLMLTRGPLSEAIAALQGADSSLCPGKLFIFWQSRQPPRVNERFGRTVAERERGLLRRLTRDSLEAAWLDPGRRCALGRAIE